MSDALAERFLQSKSFAVAGVSSNPEKYGHKCFAALLDWQHRAPQRPIAVYGVNPRGGVVLGQPVYESLDKVPEAVEGLSVITSPVVTETLVEQAIVRGVKVIWMQPGAESAKAVARAESAGIIVLHSGPCLLVALALKR